MTLPPYGKRVVPKEERLPLFPRQSNHNVRLIAIADIHLSHTPPVARSTESNWYAAMTRPLKQLRKLQEQYQVPIVCAGDIFHKWNPPCELINFALEHLPLMYAIPGQHDLPMHSYADIERSGYWTLVKAGRIKDLAPDRPGGFENVRINGFPWGHEITPIDDAHDLCQEIAVVHQYLWIKGCGYHNAPADKRLKACKSKFKGYDVVIVGDNHTPFKVTKNHQTVLNCGSLFRRNIDQIDYKPAVWLVKSDNTVEPVYLDCSKDKFLESDKLARIKVGGKSMHQFLERLKDLKDVALSFEEAVSRYLRKEKVSSEVEKIILAALENSR